MILKVIDMSSCPLHLPAFVIQGPCNQSDRVSGAEMETVLGSCKFDPEWMVIPQVVAM